MKDINLFPWFMQERVGQPGTEIIYHFDFEAVRIQLISGGRIVEQILNPQLNFS